MDNILGEKRSVRIRVGEHHPIVQAIKSRALNKLLTPSALIRLRQEHPLAEEDELREKVISNISNSLQLLPGNLMPDIKTSELIKLERLVDAALKTYYKVCKKLGIKPPKTTVSCDSRSLPNSYGTYYIAHGHIGIDLSKSQMHPFSILLHEIGHIQKKPLTFEYGTGENSHHFVLSRLGFRFQFHPIKDLPTIFSLKGASEFVAESFKLMGLKLLGYKEGKTSIDAKEVKITVRKITMESILNNVEKTLLGLSLLLGNDTDSQEVISNTRLRQLKKCSSEKEKNNLFLKIYSKFVSADSPNQRLDILKLQPLNLVIDRTRLKSTKVTTSFTMSKEIDPERLAAGLSTGDISSTDVLGCQELETRGEKVSAQLSYWTIVETFKKFAIEIALKESGKAALSKLEKEEAIERLIKIAYRSQISENPRPLVSFLKKACASTTELKLMLSFGKVHLGNLQNKTNFDGVISELWFLVREIESPEKRELETFFLLNLNILGPKECNIQMSYPQEEK